jgi:urea carboxylase-associated protein 2
VQPERGALPAIPEGAVVVDETVPPGAYWSWIVRRGQTLRVVDLEGAGAASLLALNADQPSERYNAPDTTKIQNTIFLTQGRVLFSDLGRVLLSVTGDTGGHHDTLTGFANAATTAAKYGPGHYLELRNEYHRNARDNFLAALGRHGLGRRDLVPTFNLFARVAVGPAGSLDWVPGVQRAGAAVDLRAEMHVLVILSATPHVLDPGPEYRPGPLQLTIWEGPPAAADDPCRTGTPEAERGFDNTDALFAFVAPGSASGSES